MAQIHILDSETIDKIAAGEVVERPSSVVKELVENAIDAGATAVTVEIRDGGITFIRVTDNGCGMEREQLRTAFLRHATSKIENAEDLTRISSLGFRGEALSSIAAVAKTEVITRTADSVTGSRILLEGGREAAFEEVGAPEGTTFLVRSLFYNTPVRRKFLRQPATEGGYIADLMEHLALSRPDISFKLVMGSQMKFHTSGHGDLREVIYRLYGRDMANALVPIQYDQDGVRIDGYLGRPEQVRSNRNFEIYFINGRFVRSNVVSRAVEEGYKEYLMQHKFPFCVLHITLDTDRVDVNVHPTKMDVRFTNAMAFSALLCGAVKYTLMHQEMIPDALLSTERERKAAEREERLLRERERAPEPFEVRRRDAYRVMEEAKYEAAAPKMQEFIQNPVWTGGKNGENRVKMQDKSANSDKIPQNMTRMSEDGREIAAERIVKTVSDRDSTTIPERKEPEDEEPFFTETSEFAAVCPEAEGTASPETEGNTCPETEGTASPETEGNTCLETEGMASPETEGNTCPETEGTASPETEGNTCPETEGTASPETERNTCPEAEGNACPEARRKLPPGNKTPPSEAAGAQLAHTQPVQHTLFGDRILTEDNRSKFRMIGQVFETYWLIEFEDRLLMIDQHAAHEKVNYERMMKRFRERSVVSQTLMPSVIVSLSGQEETALREHLEVFESLGFEVEAFGGSEYALRGVPMDLYGCGEREMFLEVLDQLADGGNFGSIRVVEEKIASMSCKAAVKGNNRLSTAEAEALISELLTLENPYNCPHGRPTIVSMSRSEMDRKFKRIIK